MRCAHKFLLAGIVVCLLTGQAAESADPDVTSHPQPADNLSQAKTVSAAQSTTIVRGVSNPAMGKTADTSRAPNATRDAFQQRIQQVQQERLRQEFESANRPTSWQLQNPSGIQNRYGESQFHVSGYQAPNTYFGKDQRPWTNLSAPLYERELPPNIVPVPPLTQSPVMIAPYSYWGPENTQWNMVSPARVNPNPLGGWNYATGW